MEKLGWKRKRGSTVLLLTMILVQFFSQGACSLDTSSFRNVQRSVNDEALRKSPPVKLQIINHRREVVMSNGLVQVTLSSPDGKVVGINYNGIDNLLEIHEYNNRRGYWDVVWSEPGRGGDLDNLRATNFKVIMENEEQVELSFTRTWNVANRGSQVPLNVDIRYIMRSGSSGFYFYAIMERKQGWPAVFMDQIRVVFRLQKNKFHYMALSDDRQRIMPMPEDRDPNRSRPLAYKEAVLLTNPTNPKLRGEVDDKYQYSSENKDNRVHGWICSDPAVGFWVITASDEFRTSGPTKQDLTSHVGPIVLSMFSSTHYSGRDVDSYFGGPWKKVLGPGFVYLNSVSSNKNPLTLWEDAKQQMLREVASWPYDFPQSNDFPKSIQRGTVAGQLQVQDRYMNPVSMWAKSAYVGLAAPGDVGSWQAETKGYQFWTKADENGRFIIKNVREGDYNLYAWVPGIVGDYKYNLKVTVKAGSKVNLGVLTYKPPRNGHTLWEIGIPDRSAAEFFIPDPDPNLVNHLYKNHTEKFRQYGLWARYADLYPNNDLQYTVGVSSYDRDWFFAHVTRKVGNKTYGSTTWRILFGLENVNIRGDYTLQLALASASYSNLQVRFNNPRDRRPHFSTGTIGKDNAIARHGIHGLYRFYSITVPGNLLKRGNNTIYLTQAKSGTPFEGVMYDYIRLEGPPTMQQQEPYFRGGNLQH